MTSQIPRPRPHAWVWRFARIAVRTFYRVERVGPELPSGALLLVANHPNALLDPAVVQATTDRQVRFLAKSTLFRNHPLSLFVRHSGAIPVYRRIDPGVDVSRNVEMFSAIEATLAEGEAICLFPEGISHDTGRLEQLRTGAARMALASEAQGSPVSIMPVGLNFDRVPRFRSRVTAVFGRAFGCDDLLDEYHRDRAAAVRHLTDRIRDRLRRLMVESDPRHDLPVVARADRLYASARGVSRDPAERIRRRRLIATGMAELRQHDPDRLAAILARLREYDADLQRFGLRDRNVEQRTSFSMAARFIVIEGTLALVLAPLAAVSLVVFGLPYWITGRISRRAPDLQSRATWQVASGVVTNGILITILALGVFTWLGSRAAVSAGVGLTLLAFAGLAAFERERSVLLTIRAFLALQLTPLKARARLKRQRAALATVLEQVQAWLETRAGTRS